MGDLNNQYSDAGNRLAEDTSFKLPPERKVVFYNDDFTTMDFVVDVLVSIFDKSHQEAEQIMHSVHETGYGIAGSYTYDIAVSRANLAIQAARKNGFPLRVEVEE